MPKVTATTTETAKHATHAQSKWQINKKLKATNEKRKE